MSFSSSLTDDDTKCWWVRPDGLRDEEDPKAHEKLHRVIDIILRDQNRQRDMAVYASMYSGRAPTMGWGVAVDQYVRNAPAVGRNNLSLNVTRNVIDAVGARIFSKSEPRVSVATVGGDWEKQDQASRLELGIDGAFRQTKYYEKSVMKGLDGCVFGTGFNRIRPNFDEKNVDVLRMMPWEVIVDDAEAVVGPNIIWEGPRSLYLRYYIDKGVLAHRIKMGWYAEGSEEDLAYKVEMVERLQGHRQSTDDGFNRTSNMVLVEEGWHRPSGRRASDGRYVMGVESVTIRDIPLDEYKPEMSWFRWGNSTVGFYGQGLAELGADIQGEINKLVRQIAKGHHLITGHYMVEKGSSVMLAHLNNDLAAIVKYVGQLPNYVAPAIIAPEVYQHLWQLYGKYYELAGINQQAAQAQRPVGLDSGEAQRVYADQQTETLLEKGKRFEKSVEADGMLVASAAKELSKKGAYEVRTANDDGFESINWKELEKPDDFVMYVESTSALPGTLPGKLSTAQDMLQLGAFTPQDVVEMVGLGDLLQIEKRKMASRKLVEKRVGEMLRGEQAWAPEPYINQPEALELATEMLLVAEAKGVGEEYLQPVRNFLELLKKQMKPPAPPPMPNAGPPGMPPGPPPMPTPGGPAAPGAPMPPPGANGVMAT